MRRLCNILRDMETDHLRPPDQRGLIARVKRRLSRSKRISIERPMSIFLNSYCNLDCFSCAALGMDSRPPPVNTGLREIEFFLRAMEKVHPGQTILLTGGEPTLYPELEAVCDMCHVHGFSVAMLTNGARLVSPELFDFLILDYHQVNETELQDWKDVLEASGMLYDVRIKRYHFDVQEAMDGNITKGARCSNWLKPLTLWQNVVYPCCNIMCVEWWRDTFDMSMALIEAGWTVENTGLVNVLKNWRLTLPSEVYRLCAIGCWKDSEKISWELIQA